VENSESLQKLRQDALWWFSNSEGNIPIALAIKVHRTSRTIVIERWQLAPLNTRSPITQNIIDQFHQANPPTMLTLVCQPAASQQAYLIQEIAITPTSASDQLVSEV